MKNRDDKGRFVKGKIIKIKKEDLYNLYVIEKLGSIEISKKFGCDNTTILARLREFNIPIKKINYNYLKGNEKEIVDYYLNKKLSCPQIAEIFGVSPVAIRIKLINSGIVLRKTGEEKKGKTYEEISGREKAKEHKQRLKENNAKYWLGKKRPEIMEILRKSNIGKIHTKEHNIKIGLGNKGKKHPSCSEEHRKKIGKANKGKLSGDKNPSWIDGRSKTKGPDRYGDDWDKIRYLVYLRDKFTCQKCGIKMNKDHILHIHHKVLFLQSFDNSLNNLITLCASCHRKEDAKLIRELKQKQLEVNFGA